MLSFKEATIEAEKLASTLALKRDQDSEPHRTRVRQQKELIRKLFNEKFNDWYTKFLIKETAVPQNFIFNIRQCKHGHEKYDTMLHPKFESEIKNELMTFVNSELNARGFKICKTAFNTYNGGKNYYHVYFRIEVTICHISSSSCTIM